VSHACRHGNVSVSPVGPPQAQHRPSRLPAQ